MVIVFLSLAAFGSEVRAYSFTEITSCPFVIALPGNYAVDGDLTAIGDCILVQTDSVLLNLNGYTITGNGTGSGVSDGGNARQHINVGKGTISHFKRGVDLLSTTDTVIRSMSALHHTSIGIGVGQGVVSENIVDSSGEIGIAVAPTSAKASTIRSNTVTNGAGDGITAGPRTTINQNTVTGNGGTGISAGSGSILSRNIATDNGHNGMTVASRSTVKDNTANNNDRAGIQVDCPSTVKGNTATGNASNLVENGKGCTNSVNVAP